MSEAKQRGYDNPKRNSNNERKQAIIRSPLTTIRPAIITIAIVLVSFSCATWQVVAQYTLPDHDKTVQYVDNLIDSYNLLVNEHDKSRPDFNIVKSYFSLYHEQGHSFEVVVLLTVPYSIYWVSLIFIPFIADKPNVIMDYNHTFSDLFPATVVTQGEWANGENLPFTYNDTTIHQDFVLVVYSPDISGDYMTESNNAARALYQQDQQQIPTVSQTQTVSQTISQTTTIQNLIQSPFVSELTTLTNEIIGGVIVTILVAILGGIWHKSRKKPNAELRKHYDELNGVFTSLSKPSFKISPIDLRNPTRSRISLPPDDQLYEAAILHLEDKVSNASSILASLRQWEGQVQAVASEVLGLLSGHGVTNDNPDRIIVTAVLNTYLGTKDSMQMIESKLEIKQKQAHQYPIWAICLDGAELDHGKQSEVTASFETTKECMNDEQIVNKLTELRTRRDELQSNLDKVRVACAETSDAIKKHNYTVRKRCCPSS
ncbi:MAG: hypothetical protein WB643_03175 [Candidatus Bathyarchaeia archaeon]